MGKKSKTILALLLVLLMIMTTACSGDLDEVKPPVSGSDNSSAGSEDEVVDNGNDDAAVDADADEVTITETVLYDADGIVVTATGYADDFMGPEIKVLVENNSDKNVLITADSVSVNGYMMPFASLYAEVAAGKKANESLMLMSYELEQAGIETVAELQFFIQISDPETWETVETSELLTLNTSVEDFEQPADDSGEVLYDDDGIKIVCKGLKQDYIWDGTLVFYMENTSGKSITVYPENVSVNGFMEDAGMWSDLRDGTKIIDGMSLLDLSDLEIESIDEVENIEFNLQIVNSETWDEIDTTDVIELNFE